MVNSIQYFLAYKYNQSGHFLEQIGIGNISQKNKKVYAQLCRGVKIILFFSLLIVSTSVTMYTTSKTIGVYSDIDELEILPLLILEHFYTSNVYISTLITFTTVIYLEMNQVKELADTFDDEQYSSNILDITEQYISLKNVHNQNVVELNSLFSVTVFTGGLASFLIFVHNVKGNSGDNDAIDYIYLGVYFIIMFFFFRMINQLNSAINDIRSIAEQPTFIRKYLSRDLDTRNLLQATMEKKVTSTQQSTSDKDIIIEIDDQQPSPVYLNKAEGEYHKLLQEIKSIDTHRYQLRKRLVTLDKKITKNNQQGFSHIYMAIENSDSLDWIIFKMLLCSDWDNFSFFGFDIEKILMMPEEMLERKAKDPKIIRNFNKVKTIKANAQMIFEEQQNGHSFAEFIANWPSDDIIGLWQYLKKNGQRLGGNTGPYALRTIGKDSFILSQDVEAYFRAHDIISGGVQTKGSLHAIQESFHQWQQQSGLALSQLSRMVAFATGDNHIHVES